MVWKKSVPFGRIDGTPWVHFVSVGTAQSDADPMYV